ncbi:MAG TPA: hypothetical protein DGG94_11485 [Micromonosporaceae bacterium]|nr:hypothetical protein [Micromonosporaceae bacterium]
MARIRSVKPEFFRDQDLAVEVPNRDARLLYIGLWGIADEHGRLRGDAMAIKGELFAYDDDLTPEVIDKLIDLLAETGRVIRYRSRKSVYLYLPKLSKHQRLEPHKTPSRLPEPPVDLQQRPSENFPEESVQTANKSAPKQVASSKEQVAGGKSADARAPTATRAQLARATRLIVDANAVTPELAAQVALAIDRERKPRNLPGLVRTLAESDDLGEWFEKAEKAINSEAVTAAIGRARASPRCPHGEPGGDHPHPTSNKPLCPLCRLGAPP